MSLGPSIKDPNAIDLSLGPQRVDILLGMSRFHTPSAVPEAAGGVTVCRVLVVRSVGTSRGQVHVDFYGAGTGRNP